MYDNVCNGGMSTFLSKEKEPPHTPACNRCTICAGRSVSGQLMGDPVVTSL